jgi:primosomal replication protein N
LNDLHLSASIAQVLPLRYTPAGLPALDVMLEHESDVTDAGMPRKVKLSLRGVAFGIQAETLSRADLTAKWHFKGFLAQARNGKGVVFHIQDIQRI